MFDNYSHMALLLFAVALVLALLLFSSRFPFLLTEELEKMQEKPDTDTYLRSCFHIFHIEQAPACTMDADTRIHMRIMRLPTVHHAPAIAAVLAGVQGLA
ncbi:hypothetical protein F5Y10DRAFT_263605 [Nemania abortiva]|nr:hypothetical protein F5Y10DRAFT_263605 [Nemania abortiva]